jgi:hypothetical protein
MRPKYITRGYVNEHETAAPLTEGLAHFFP